MKTIGIIGVGSPFGADNIAEKAIYLMRQQQAQGIITSDIDIQYYDRPGFHLLEIIKSYQTLHLIDAMVSGQAVGTIHRIDDINAIKTNDFMFSSHGVGVAETLTLGEALNCLPDKIIIHAIEIDPKKSHQNELNASCEELVNRLIRTEI